MPIGDTGTVSTEDLERRLRQLEGENAQLRQQLFGETEEVVRVPAEIQDLFVQAQEKVDRFFSTFCADPSRATIEVEQERYILIRGASVAVDFFRMVRRIFPPDELREADEFAARLLYDLSHGAGRNDETDFAERMHLTDPVERLSAGPVHFAYAGWANVELLPPSNPIGDEDHLIVYRHHRSFEADSWLEAGVAVDHPVCSMNAGYSAGWCEKAFGLHLEAVEVSCRARGDEHCCFVMAPPHRLREQLERLHEEYPEYVPDASIDSGRDFLARREIAAAARRDDRAAATRMRSERRLLAYAHALEATRDMLHRKVGELEREIRHRRDAQTNLEATQRTLDEVGIAVLWVDPSERLLYANQAAGHLFGHAPESLTEMSLSDLEVEGNALRAEERRAQLESEGSNVTQAWMRHADGRKFPVEIHSVFRREESRAFAFCFIEDITERLARDRERMASQREAERSARESTAIVSTLSHEIRTPLTAIVSTVDLLREAELEPELHELAATAADASDHLLHLVERMLDFNRVEASPDTVRLEAVDTRGWFERVVRVLEPKAREKGLDLRCEFVGPVPERLEMDAGALQQVLFNLGHNAVKATREGFVALRLHTLYADEAVAQIQFEVEDSGPGIDPDDQVLLFRPFTSVGAEERRREGGAGLGLAISQRLCERMGTQIAVQSSVGRGTRFWFAIGARRVRD